MEINKEEIENILHNNVTNNLICRALETRSGELAKYICGLANTEGGYILIGVERDNGVLKIVGFQLAFDMDIVINVASKKLEGACFYKYGYISMAKENIFVIKVEKSKQRILVDNTHFIYKNNGVGVKKISELNEPPTLFISYTECDTPIVDIIEKKIQEKLRNKVLISRYSRLEYKDSFKGFMNTIQDHDFVLTVVSDTYLKRQACMYEVGEIIKDHHYKDKLLFVVLSENERKYYGENVPEKIGANIYNGAEVKLEYVEFWKNKYNQLKERINNIDDYEATSEAAKELQILGQIYRKDMKEFLEFLSDENGKTFQNLYENDFDELIRWIYPNCNVNIFNMCDSFDDLLSKAIAQLHYVTKTDYNQIALGVKIESHKTGLVVFADDIVEYKQRYRLVVMDGLVAKAYVTGNSIIIGNVKKETDYFCAVVQTNSELVLPIKHGGKVIGVFNSESEERNYYNKGMIEKLSKILENFSNRIIELGYIGNMEQKDIPYVHI
ncbi:MAG: putative DNA binding domain-containing protein [Acetatifactor sp.]|nr:putative DNA binding domain-containing protein [Acetatifactor sp.]